MPSRFAHGPPGAGDRCPSGATLRRLSRHPFHGGLSGSLLELRTGRPLCFAPRPPGAIRSGFAGRKHSGIPSVTVVPTVILRSVPAFLLRTPGGAPAATANVAERTRSPEGKRGICRRERERRDALPAQPRRISRSSGHVRETQQTRLSYLFGFSGLSGVFDPINETNQIDQTNQTNQTDRLRPPPKAS
jgi:hypothetical protein